MIRVVLADDQPLIRAGFRALLESEDDIAVVAEGVDGLEAMDLVRAHLPDVVLLDVRMPRLDGIEATRRMAADDELAGVHIVILTNYAEDEYVHAALRAGACGFLVKDIEPEELIHGVRVAARGDALLAPTVIRKLIEDYMAAPPRPVTPPALNVLTGREREVMVLVAGGLSNDEIAARLAISALTAKTHVSRAMTKLGARDRAQLVVYAYESGLVTPGV